MKIEKSGSYFAHFNLLVTWSEYITWSDKTRTCVAHAHMGVNNNSAQAPLNAVNQGVKETSVQATGFISLKVGDELSIFVKLDGCNDSTGYQVEPLSVWSLHLHRPTSFYPGFLVSLKRLNLLP